MADQLLPAAPLRCNYLALLSVLYTRVTESSAVGCCTTPAQAGERRDALAAAAGLVRAAGEESAGRHHPQFALGMCRSPWRSWRLRRAPYSEAVAAGLHP